MNMLEQENPRDGRQLVTQDYIDYQSKQYVVGNFIVSVTQVPFPFWIDRGSYDQYGDAGDYVVNSNNSLLVHMRSMFEDEAVEVT